MTKRFFLTDKVIQCKNLLAVSYGIFENEGMWVSDTQLIRREYDGNTILYRI
ncbi:hypothetical protein GcM1_135007 [Golovinomyces cichoracearum]|uniref:Uncharacterized protein n=1 Tax=Golovinomyces cichoracearum TaxID=62708 RepID=A0A420JBQ9_9PEZI|nr:hypothetical protein GcM1_135007 [Golovinomyces cichoracearum]